MNLVNGRAENFKIIVFSGNSQTCLQIMILIAPVLLISHYILLKMQFNFEYLDSFFFLLG